MGEQEKRRQYLIQALLRERPEYEAMEIPVLNAEKNLHPADGCDTLAVKEIQERKRKWQDI